MIKAIVTDIEGTTSSLSFVKDVLFPYARQNMAGFIKQHCDDPQVLAQLQAVNQEAGKTLSPEEAIAQLITWIDEDKKITPLKTLQGLIWEAGYRNGDFTGHIYDDAAANLQKWQQQGMHLYVFSSGSVYAQKLLFGHTEYGDLTTLFDGFFDTTTGNKRDAAAYGNIARQTGFPPQEILFLSDIVEELDAAREAGMQTVWLSREGAGESNPTHPQVASFDAILL
jgi:enolase-phosphatase E1